MIQEISRDIKSVSCPEQHYQSTWSNCHVYAITSNNRVHILLKLTWNVPQVNHILAHKTCLKKLKKLETTFRNFSEKHKKGINT